MFFFYHLNINIYYSLISISYNSSWKSINSFNGLTHSTVFHSKILFSFPNYILENGRPFVKHESIKYVRLLPQKIQEQPCSKNSIHFSLRKKGKKLVIINICFRFLRRYINEKPSRSTCNNASNGHSTQSKELIYRMRGALDVLSLPNVQQKLKLLIPFATYIVTGN